MSVYAEYELLIIAGYRSSPLDGLQMLNSNCTLLDIDVLDCQGNGFRYAAAQTEQQPDQ
jgi:hypothetical protein